MKKRLGICVSLIALSCAGNASMAHAGFPFLVPAEKPDRPLSAAVERNYDAQYAEDWVNFKIAAIVELMPTAGGPFVPDAFSDTKDGRGITWGLSHFTNAAGDWKRNHSVLARFDCDLSLDIHDENMKGHYYKYGPEFYYQHALSSKQKERIQNLNKKRLASSRKQ